MPAERSRVVLPVSAFSRWSPSHVSPRRFQINHEKPEHVFVALEYQIRRRRRSHRLALRHDFTAVNPSNDALLQSADPRLIARVYIPRETIRESACRPPAHVDVDCGKLILSRNVTG